jgi:hypothetical protein
MSISSSTSRDLRNTLPRKGLKLSSSASVDLLRTLPRNGSTLSSSNSIDLLKTLPRNGLKSSCSGAGAALGRGPPLEGVRLAGEAMLPPTRLSGFPEPGVASSGRVGVGASLTIRLVANRAARASEGLLKVNCAEGRALGNFSGDLDLRRSKASGLFRERLAFVGDA